MLTEVTSSGRVRGEGAPSADRFPGHPGGRVLAGALISSGAACVAALESAGWRAGYGSACAVGCHRRDLCAGVVPRARIALNSFTAYGEGSRHVCGVSTLGSSWARVGAVAVSVWAVCVCTCV